MLTGYESEGAKSTESKSTSATIIKRIATGGNEQETPSKKKIVVAPSSSRVVRNDSRLSLTAEDLTAKQIAAEP